MSLVLSEHPHGVATEDGRRVVYDLERNEASFGAARVDAPAVVWELTDEPGRASGSSAATGSTSRRAASRIGTCIRAAGSGGSSSVS